MRNHFPVSLPLLAGLMLLALPLASWSDAGDNAAIQDSLSASRSDSASAAAIPTDPLLPEVLSPGEHLMWGEHGLMRITGAFPLTEESREKEMSLRRAMLTVHQ